MKGKAQTDFERDSKNVRTNNNLEGYHSRLKKVVMSPKPNIYKIIEVIQREDDKYSIQYIRIVEDIIKSKPRD